MAAIYRPSAAFDFVKTMVKNLPLEDIGHMILDRINKIMWMAAPWRWTLSSMTEITLVANTQDYAIAALPADFLYLVSAYITEGEQLRPITVVPFLPTAVGIKGTPNQIAVTGSAGAAGTARVYPKPGASTPVGTQKIYMIYKKTAPSIKNNNQSTAGVLVADDEWFWVYESGVLWLSYAYADDQRAGGATVDASGKYQFTGQRAVFEANLALMKIREKMPDVSIIPTTQVTEK